MTGRISSLQSLGASDGPGVRYVTFLQGCPLRCIYCHNPETWDIREGKDISAEELFEKIKRCVPYFGDKGGITLSGGEPLLQSEFAFELFSLCKSNDIHTALDTSGIGANQHIEKLLDVTDLVICDIKFTEEELYLKNCKGHITDVLNFLDLTEKKEIPLWIRHVVVPNLTDTEEEIFKVISIAEKYSNLKKIELLPFKKLCLDKYNNLGIPFPLENTPNCSEELIKKLLFLIPEKLR